LVATMCKYLTPEGQRLVVLVPPNFASKTCVLSLAAVAALLLGVHALQEITIPDTPPDAAARRIRRRARDGLPSHNQRLQQRPPRQESEPLRRQLRRARGGGGGGGRRGAVAAPSTGASGGAASGNGGGEAFPSVRVEYAEEEGYHAQDGQDKWLDEHLFRGRRGGVFVDIGCYDGVTYSNTHYYEVRLGWSGVCAEPNPEVYPRIAAAGRSSGAPVAVSDTAGMLPFTAAFMRSSLNRSAVDFDFLRRSGVSSKEVLVPVETPSQLLRRLPAAARERGVIDFVSLDVEQLELRVLEAWPWGDFCVDSFTVENEPPAGEPSTLPRLRRLLLPRGYEHRARVGQPASLAHMP